MKLGNQKFTDKNFDIELVKNIIYSDIIVINKMGTCCEPTKAYRNANRKTGNMGTIRHGSKSHYDNEDKKSINQRKGRLLNSSQQQNEIKYNEILGEEYPMPQLDAKDLGDLPYDNQMFAQEFNYCNLYVKPVSAVNQAVITSVYDSQKGLKTYKTTYPKIKE